MKEASTRHSNWTKPLLGGLVVLLILTGLIVLYQQSQIISQKEEIASLDNSLAVVKSHTTNLQTKITALQQEITNQQKQIATLFSSSRTLPRCTTLSRSQVAWEYPPEQVFLLNQVVPLLQNISGMAVVSNYTAGTGPGETLFSQIVSTSFHVISGNKSSSMTTYDVSLNNSASSGTWANGSIHYQPYVSRNTTFSVKPNGTVSESREFVNHGTGYQRATSSNYFANSTAVSDFAWGMFPFVRQEYCQSLGAEIESLSSAQFVPNGTTISTLGSTTMSVANFQANLPLNTTDIPVIWDYDYKTRLLNVTDFSMQVGLVPVADIPLLVAIHVSYWDAGVQLTIRVTSVDVAGEA